MPRIIVQIYEVQTPPEAEAVLAAGVDHIGSVVLSEKEWKNALLKETIKSVQRLGGVSSLILLFNQPDAVMRAIDYYRPQILHFCESLVNGAGMAVYCQRLVDLQQKIKEHFSQLKLMRSIPISPAGIRNRIPTLELGCMFEPVSDFLLTDTLLGNQTGAADPQPVLGFVGITGRTCNWDTARRLVLQSRIPVILAGGISPRNVAAGIRWVKPAGVDSCTLTNAVGTGGTPIRFKKDLRKVRQLVENARCAERRLSRQDEAQTSFQ